MLHFSIDSRVHKRKHVPPELRESNFSLQLHYNLAYLGEQLVINVTVKFAFKASSIEQFNELSFLHYEIG